MPAGDPARPLDAVSQRLCDLAHRRLAYYSELSKSGRWKLYFTEREFIERLRDVIAVTNAWNELAGRPGQHNGGAAKARRVA
jgi:uncharacterized repeat protein (TIGR03809 family)